MSFLNRLSKSLRQGVGDMERKAQVLREEINLELAARKLRCRLKNLRSEEQETYRLMGQRLYRALAAGNALRPSDYSEQCEYLSALQGRIKDTETQINTLYRQDGPCTEDVDDAVMDDSGSEG